MLDAKYRSCLESMETIWHFLSEKFHKTKFEIFRTTDEPIENEISQLLRVFVSANKRG